MWDTWDENDDAPESNDSDGDGTTDISHEEGGDDESEYN